MSADICCQYEQQSKTTMANRLFLVLSEYVQNIKIIEKTTLITQFTAVYSPL